MPALHDEAPNDEERERVAAVLAGLRAGVRQRRAEVATVGEAGELPDDAGLQGRLLQLQQSEYVREPVPTSHRKGLGRWIVFGRKSAYHAFLKWLVRPLLEQQNAHNAASAALLQELAESEARLAKQVRELTLRLEALERSSPRRTDAENA